MITHQPRVVLELIHCHLADLKKRLLSRLNQEQ